MYMSIFHNSILYRPYVHMYIYALTIKITQTMISLMDNYVFIPLMHRLLIILKYVKRNICIKARQLITMYDACSVA